MDEKAQGSLEYLLLIGGAIIIAVIVYVVLTSIAPQTQNKINQTTNRFFNLLNV
jgi:uncharacterized protein (UPF0333 family)